MAWVVLLRATNVGGRRRFLPSEFAKGKALAEFHLVNLGAAGTFVARTKATESRLRRAIVAQLPFETEVTLCPGEEILRLIGRNPFAGAPIGAKPYLSVLVADAVRTPRIPFHAPEGSEWEVRLVAAQGRYILSVARRLTERLTYPNPVVEREFGVSATTRGWPTVVALGQLLETS